MPLVEASSQTKSSLHGMWIRLNRNNRARYSRKTEAKTGMLPRKETNIRETQVSLESPEMFGNSDLSRKHVFSANSTRPVGQVLLEIHSSEIREYSSQTGRRAEENFTTGNPAWSE